MKIHTFQQPVSFGDCDPAGIVFYPNVFSWFDRAFHDWLKRFGGHARLCEQFDAVGLGLMEVGAQFRRPMRDGDTLTLTVSIEEWSRKSVRLRYEGSVDGTPTVVGTEVRGLFKLGDKGMFAAEMDALRGLVESDGQ